MKSKQFTLSDVLAMLWWMLLVLAITVIATTPLTAVILFIIAYRILVG